MLQTHQEALLLICYPFTFNPLNFTYSMTPYNLLLAELDLSGHIMYHVFLYSLGNRCDTYILTF